MNTQRHHGELLPSNTLIAPIVCTSPDNHIRRSNDQQCEISVQTITTTDGWDELQQEWTTLFETSPAASPALQFDWLRSWWRVYGITYGRMLWIFAVRRDGELIGVLPLYESLHRGPVGVCRSYLLSSGEAEHEETAAEYLGLLYAAGEEQTCIEALTSILKDKRQHGRWHEIEIRDIPTNSPLVHLPAAKRQYRIEYERAGVCPIADLSEGFEAYLEKLSSKVRKYARRLFRSIEKLDVHFEVASNTAQADEFFNDLIELHQERWTAVGRPGCFAAPRFTEFHRDLARLWVPQGKAVLVRLRVNNINAAVLYGFLSQRQFHFYQSGVRISDRISLESPGTAAQLLLMRHLAEHGVRTYNFLRGASFYKQRLATGEESLVRLRIIRFSIRTRVVAALESVKQLAHRLRANLPIVAKPSPTPSTSLESAPNE